MYFIDFSGAVLRNGQEDDINSMLFDAGSVMAELHDTKTPRLSQIRSRRINQMNNVNNFPLKPLVRKLSYSNSMLCIESEL